MKLLKILPENISEQWDFYAPLLAKGLPPTAGDSYKNMVNVLEATLLEKLICWGYYSDENELMFLVTTTIYFDEISKNRKLLIYSFTGLCKITNIMFSDALNKLKKYAKSEECSHIIAYTRNEKIVNYLSNGSIGADVGYRLIEMEV